MRRLRFSYYMDVVVRVRDDRLLVKFIGALKDAGASIMDVNEEERRVFFKASLDLVDRISSLLDEYAYSAMYEVKGKAQHDLSSRKLAKLYKALTGVGNFKLVKPEGSYTRLIGLLSLETPILVEVYPSRSKRRGVVILRALRPITMAGIADYYVIPRSLSSFEYRGGEALLEHVGRIAPTLLKAERIVREAISKVRREKDL